jgi:hypothetical protein
MPITVSGTAITFNDATTQTTAFIAGGGGQLQNQLFVSGTATWTAPTGVTRAKVTVYGGGGGGNWNWSSWGGNGGMMQAFVTVTPGTAYTVTVGAGGGGGGAGSPGGTSSFGSLVSATGGGGGPNVSNAIGSMGTGSTTGTAIVGGNAGGGVAAGINAGFMRGPFAGSARTFNANAAVAYSPTADFGAGGGGWRQISPAPLHASGGTGGVVYVEWVGS